VAFFTFIITLQSEPSALLLPPEIQFASVMEDGGWVHVRQPTEKDQWNPSSMEAESSTQPLKITFTEPAKHWTDALPIGNGRLGAMVWGGVASETLQLNGITKTSFAWILNEFVKKKNSVV
jgi:hypothetical protein